MDSRDYSIGIDVGGTFVKAVAADRAGGILEREQRDTADGQREGEVPLAATAARTLIAQWEQKLGPARGLGISAPGVAHPDGRMIHFMAGRMQDLVGFDWGSFLGRPAVVSNDAHAALVGEAWVGAARGMRNVALFTLGTGVGGALLIDGELFRGHTGRAGHLGHLCLDPWGEPGIFKTPGVLEDFIGQSTVERRTERKFRSVEELVAAVREGEAYARESWQKSIRALACGIATVANIFDPEAIVLSGGITAAGDLLWKPLEEELHLVEWRPHGHQVRILPAELGAWSGALGNARLGWESAEKAS